MDSFKRFSDKQLPDRSKFFTSLKEECISEKDYLHDIDVWNMLKREINGWLLWSLFKNRRFVISWYVWKVYNTCWDYYGLDPCHCFSSPGLSWDAIVKMTEIELELISDTDMYFFLEKEMTGGISHIAERFSKANSKCMELHIDNKPRKYIMYLDPNNLCGWAISQYLPYGEFKWLNQKENKFDINSIGENSLVGYVLQFDLEYPDKLNELHNDSRRSWNQS